MRILIRTSNWAIWSRRLASFSLPLAVVPIFMYRAQMMTMDTFHIVEGLAASIAILALLMGLVACVRLWFTGDLGWGRAIGGIFLALVCLAPFGLGLFLALHYPAITDISTDLADRPALVSTIPTEQADATAQEKIDAAFPNARTRRYQVDAPMLYSLVTKLVDGRGWQVLRSDAPVAAMGQGQINAVATRLVGWRDEVAIRVREDQDGASVAMRSAQIDGLPRDMGANGQRIEEFLVALDNEVTLLMRNQPQPASADDADADAAPTDTPAN